MGGGARDVLDDSLVFPKEALAHVSIHQHRRLVASRDIEAAERHYLEARQYCPGRATNKHGVNIRYTSPDAVCVVNAGIPSGEMGHEERIAVDWPALSVTSYGAWAGNPALKSGVTGRLIFGESGLVHWNPGRSGPVEYLRESRPSFDAALTGVLLVHNRRLAQIQRILVLAEEQGAIQEEATHLRALADLSSPEALGRFDGVSLPNGFMDTPGYAEIRFELVDNQRILRVDGRDCLDALVFRYQVTWGPESMLPSRSQETRYMVGTEAILSDGVVHFAELSKDRLGEELKWTPGRGEVVFDSRFGPELEYEIQSDGTVPTDRDLLAMADELESVTDLRIPSGIEETVFDATNDHGGMHVSSEPRQTAAQEESPLPDEQAPPTTATRIGTAALASMALLLAIGGLGLMAQRRKAASK